MELLLGVVVVTTAVWLVIQRIRQKPKFLSTNEYWVYLPDTKMPPQDAVMQHVLSDTYAQRGRKPVTPREGLLMSDIRLHIALVLRSKNPHVFRPDLFEEHIEPTPEILEALANSESLVKVRYISETPLKDRANIQLVPHLALAVAELGNGKVIYDCVKEELLLRADLQDVALHNLDLTIAGLQVRSIWRRSEHGGWAETRGLRKIGLPELATEPMEADEQVLVTEVIGDAARTIWEAGELLPKVHVKLFDDDFEIAVGPPKNGVAHVRILRIQAI